MLTDISGSETAKDGPELKTPQPSMDSINVETKACSDLAGNSSDSGEFDLEGVASG